MDGLANICFGYIRVRHNIMTRLHLIAFILLINICFAQTKQQIINSIIKVNSVHSDCVGIGCMESKQYRNFQKLKKMLTDSELIALTKNKNAVIRIYASIEVIQSGKGNVEKLLLNELDKRESVETYEGCIVSREFTSSIIYHEYWNKIRMKASRGISDENESEVAMKKALETDKTMEKLDSLIIHTDKNVYWLLYDRCFENRKHKDSYLPRIERLAFQQNNAYAIKYLKNYYPNQTQQKIKAYFENDFKKVNFKSEKNYEFFQPLIEFLVESNDKEYLAIAAEKIKEDKSVWKNNSYWVKNIMKEHGVKLD